MLNDVRHAVRLLFRQRGFTLAACATLALGIGANVAIFSIVDSALFRPLPYRDPDRLMDIVQVLRRGRVEETRSIGMTWQAVAEWRAEQQLFEGVATSGESARVTVGIGVDAGSRVAGRLSPGFLKFLGLAPVAGREFIAEDLARDAAVVMLSASLWRHAFSGDPAVIGRTIVVDGRNVTIVGVAPPTFRYRVFRDELWLPQQTGEARKLTGVLARIRPGLTLTQAEQELDRAAERIQRERPSTDRWEVDLQPIDTRRGSDTAEMLLALVGAVGFVLLIACANVANLLLSRMLTRQRELAIRSAVGATRGRLVRQTIVEGCLLAGLGGALGIVVAWWCTAAVPAVVPDQLRYALFGTNPIVLDARLAGSALCVVMLTVVFCSIAPAMRASRPVTLGSMTRLVGSTPASRRLRQAFLAVQVGATLVLIVGAGLLVNSVLRMISGDPGFDIDRLGSVFVSSAADKPAPPGPAQSALYGRLLERVRSLPGVEAAGFGTPPAGGLSGRFVIEGPDGSPQETSMSTSIHYVDPGYFDLCGVELRAGRDITPTDTASSDRVALVDEETARRAFPGTSPIGHRFRYSPYVRWITVVGVVERVKTDRFRSKRPDAQLYLPLTQSSMPGRTLLLRSTQPSAAIAAAVAALPAVDPALSAGPSAVASDSYDSVLNEPRFYLMLVAALAFVALVTAAVGLYGVLTCSVGERTREIAIRIALGADPTQVARLMTRDALVPVAAGLIAGLLIAAWLTRFLESLLYQITRLDPATLTLAVLTMLIVSAFAAARPLRRAIRIDPIAVLKAE